jgi:hypothetical protein
MLGVEAEGRSTRIAESATELERLERVVIADSEMRDVRASFEAEDDFLSLLLLLSLSAVE